MTMRAAAIIALVLLCSSGLLEARQKYAASDGKSDRALEAAVFTQRHLDGSDDNGGGAVPATDEGGLSIAAVNRMIEGAVRGVKARK